MYDFKKCKEGTLTTFSKSVTQGLCMTKWSSTCKWNGTEQLKRGKKCWQSVHRHLFYLQFLLWKLLVQVILFEIDYANLHELFCQFISWTNWVNSGKFMDNWWISYQVMADMKKVYNNLIIINLYRLIQWDRVKNCAIDLKKNSL